MRKKNDEVDVTTVVAKIIEMMSMTASSVDAYLSIQLLDQWLVIIVIIVVIISIF